MSEQQIMYDAAIIGTGPAGISAAITLKLRNKNIILFGSQDLSAKLQKAHTIQNYPGIPSVSGEELKQKLLNHLETLNIQITQEQITGCYSMGKYFGLLTKSNQTINARTVIVATGVNFGKPYPGEEEFLGKGVSYCATCDAPLYKGKNCIVIGQTPEDEKEADFMAQICSKVTYIPLYIEETLLKNNVQVVRDVPLKIEGGIKAQKLILKNQELEADGIFILRNSIPPKQLVPGLAIENNHITVNRKMQTNIPGCFACGDITGTPYQYIKAAGEGNIAALSAVEYLDQAE